MKLEDMSGATFSPCRQYRYALWRRWAEGPALNMICLNPSTAAETDNDPTVTRQIKRAQMLGYPGFVMTNIFGWRSTDPSVLPGLADPIGPDNDLHILREATAAGLVICAWGGWGKINTRGNRVANMLRVHKVKLHTLRMSNEGIPGYPLYLSYDRQPEEWVA